MSTPSTSDPDAATRARICKHMNTDHTHHLALYLRHYNHLPSSQITQPTLVDLSLDSLTLSAGPNGGHFHIPLDPPMKHYGESRERLKAMAYEAMEGCGESPYKVSRFVWPKPVGWVVIASVILGEITTLGRNTHLIPGAWVRENLLFGYAPVADWMYNRGILLFGVILTIHIVEMGVLWKTRLSKHGVKPFSGNWILWMLGAFFEGVGTFKRFDREVYKVKKEAGGVAGLKKE